MLPKKKKMGKNRTKSGDSQKEKSPSILLVSVITGNTYKTLEHDQSVKTGNGVTFLHRLSDPKWL